MSKSVISVSPGSNAGTVREIAGTIVGAGGDHPVVPAADLAVEVVGRTVGVADSAGTGTLILVTWWSVTRSFKTPRAILRFGGCGRYHVACRRSSLYSPFAESYRYDREETTRSSLGYVRLLGFAFPLVLETLGDPCLWCAPYDAFGVPPEHRASACTLRRWYDAVVVVTESPAPPSVQSGRLQTGRASATPRQPHGCR